MTYVFVGDRGGEVVAVDAVFVAFGDAADLDQAVTEAVVANDFPLIPLPLFEAAQKEADPKHAARLALANFRETLTSAKPAVTEQGPATPAEKESENVSA